jgi:glycerol-3-phosphate acyltransferase PlsX
MKIIIDAMGGDFAPLEQIKGALDAKKEIDFKPILVGHKEKILACAKENGLDLSELEIVHAENVISMSDPPLSVRSVPDTSLRVGFTMLAKGEADAMVSAGSTGAVQVGATLFVKRVPGAKRAAIGTVVALSCPVLILDCGANTTYNEDIFAQYAVMGSLYMKIVCGLENPRVGLLNIGSEEHKGTEEHVKAYQRLKSMKEINFIGNVEAGSVPYGACDVLVTDGFAGNVLLKSMEGMSKFLMLNLKETLTSSPKNKIAGLLCKKDVYAMKKKYDASEYGGAPLLGISAPVIKAHGNSDAHGMKNAILQAAKLVDGKTVEKIKEALAAVAEA